MANITKFKDKKTGEVYDLGPKTWEITLTEEQYISLLQGEQIDVSQMVSTVMSDYKDTDRVFVKAYTGMGDYCFEISQTAYFSNWNVGFMGNVIADIQGVAFLTIDYDGQAVLSFAQI